MRLFIAGIALLGFAAPLARADSSINETNRHAYGANVGWVNLRGDATNGVVIGEFTCRGYAHAANVGWIRFGNGAPTNGIRYGNAAANDCGINHDGMGGLSGYAYGANVGWIQFEPTWGNPRIDLATGKMSGYACGSAGEPCVPPTNRPYFRSTNNATRAQTAKIVANTFFPECCPTR